MNGAARLRTDRRGVTPAIAKAMEATIVVLFVAAMTTALYGGVIPDYRTAAGSEVADRTVAAAAAHVEGAIPPAAHEVRAVHRVDLPVSIRGAGYRIVVRGETLVLEHPAERVRSRTRLALPDRVVRVTGVWESGGDPVVLVTDVPGGFAIRLTDRTALGQPPESPTSGDVEGSA